MPSSPIRSLLRVPAGAPLSPGGPPRLAVAVSGRLAGMPAGLRALLRQATPEGLALAPGSYGVVLAPQDRPEEALALAAHLAQRLPFPLRVALPAQPAGPGAAGWAWRRGMLAAADWVGPAGMVVATEAAAVPEPGWLAAHVAALGAGAEAVAGRHRPAAPPNPASRYAAALEEIAARLDPDPDDPWPRHGEELSANLAVRAGVLAGGVPASGGAGLLAALRLRDARIRHAPDALVALPDAGPGPVPEQFAAAHRRIRARAALRRLWRDGVGVGVPESAALRQLARSLGLPAGEVARHLGARHFGAAWAAVEAASGVLAPRLLAATAADRARARLLLGWLRVSA